MAHVQVAKFRPKSFQTEISGKIGIGLRSFLHGQNWRDISGMWTPDWT